MTADLHLLAAAFALDALDPGERTAFEAHLHACDMCSDEVAEFREAASHLAAADEVAPPPELRNRVLAEISVTRQTSPLHDDTPVRIDHRWSRPPLWLAAAAAALVVVVAGVGLAFRPSDSTTQFEQVFNAPDAVLTSLEGDAGDMQVLWSPSLDEVVVFANDLPDVPSEQAYALWFVTDDGVQPAGLFSPEDGRVRQAIDVADIDPAGWGITIEPATGSPQPTTDVIYSATL